MRPFILMVTTLTYMTAFGQNLILNGDFENCTCPTVHSFLKSCKYVKALCGTTPDYFNYCEETFNNPIYSFMGSQVPFSGNGHAGLILVQTSEFNYTEYIAFALEEPLLPLCYELSLRISWADCAVMKVDKLGFLFTNDSENLKCKNYVLKGKSQAINLSGPAFDDKLAWNKVGAIYCASGGEKELVLGNFHDILKSLKLDQPIIEKSPCFRKKCLSYCYIDDVRLVPLDEAGAEEHPEFTHY
jgi:hypothetical protein